MSLRANVFKAKKKRSRIIHPSFLAESDTPDVEVRVMSVAERTALIDASTANNGDRNTAVFLARLVIETAYVPGTEDKVFSPADQDELTHLPSDVVDELAEPALNINGLMMGAVQVAEKN